MRLPSLLGSAVLAATALCAAPASACWDGLAASGRGVHVSIWQDASWNPATARQMAVWITRLEAVVPADTEIQLTNGILQCEGVACPEGAFLEVPHGDLARAFDAAATLFGVTRDATDRGSPFRVVVGAHRERSEAEAAAAQLRAHGVAAFVRTMPDQPTFDEPVSSSGG